MDEVWKRDEPDSPCVKICVVHPEAKICIGCHRTIEEISRWGRMDAEERVAVRAQLPDRASLLKGRRKGRRRG